MKDDGPETVSGAPGCSGFNMLIFAYITMDGRES